jgi:hypothetical protein
LRPRLASPLLAFHRSLERANASGAREPGARKMPCPSPCAVRDALAWHVDLGAAPKPAMLEVLAAFAADETVRMRVRIRHYINERISFVEGFRLSSVMWLCHDALCFHVLRIAPSSHLAPSTT